MDHKIETTDNQKIAMWQLVGSIIALSLLLHTQGVASFAVGHTSQFSCSRSRLGSCKGQSSPSALYMSSARDDRREGDRHVETVLFVECGEYATELELRWLVVVLILISLLRFMSCTLCIFITLFFAQDSVTTVTDRT
jgi:hypothetical protein